MMKKLICKLFGHVYVEEVYATPLISLERRYIVIRKVKVCSVRRMCQTSKK